MNYMKTSRYFSIIVKNIREKSHDLRYNVNTHVIQIILEKKNSCLFMRNLKKNYIVYCVWTHTW